VGSSRTPDPGRLRIAWSSDPATLDPALAVDVVGSSAVALLCEGLVTFDAGGRPVPALASSWEVSNDGLEYRFTIDENARASDGSSLGAGDVVASFRRLLDPETASPRAWVLERIAGAEEFRAGTADSVAGLLVEADGTLVIRLGAPSASFLGLLAMPNAGVLPAGVADPATVSTGPWVLAERVRDSHLLFRANPHWHGRAPGFRELHVRILPEEFTRVAEFEVGNLDVLEVPASASKRFRDSEFASRLHRQVALVTEYVGLNNDDPVLADPRVRRALNHAIDVDLILEKVLGGRGVRSSGAVPPSLPGGESREPFAHDPALARRLLDEAGVPGDWTLTLWQRPSPLASQVLEAIQSDLTRLGVKAEIRLRDWNALKAAIDRGEPQSFFINWYADYPDAENFLVPLFHSSNIGGGGNRARYRDPAVDADLARLDRETDPERRAALARDLDGRIRNEAPWIYLWHPILEVAVAERVAGFRPHPVPACERWLDVRLEAAPAGAS
jgi:peptide/nickel transport system substrate-binding protein/oligopeptide transport system substrate-binding protein